MRLIVQPTKKPHKHRAADERPMLTQNRGTITWKYRNYTNHQNINAKCFFNFAFKQPLHNSRPTQAK